MRKSKKCFKKYTNLLLFLCILVLILLCLVLHVQKVLKTGFWNPRKIYTFVCFRRHLTGMYNLKIQHFKNTGVLEDVAYKLLLWSLEFKTRADKGVRKEESYGLQVALVIRAYQLKHMLGKKRHQENNKGKRAHKITCRRASLLTKQVTGAKDHYVAQQCTTSVRLTHATSVQGTWKHDDGIMFACLYTQFSEYFQGMN